jgi:hypothetical protein
MGVFTHAAEVGEVLLKFFAATWLISGAASSRRQAGGW